MQLKDRLRLLAPLAPSGSAVSLVHHGDACEFFKCHIKQFAADSAASSLGRSASAFLWFFALVELGSDLLWLNLLRSPFGTGYWISAYLQARAGRAQLFALYALLLFRLPSVFTLYALLLLLEFEERSHQFTARCRSAPWKISGLFCAALPLMFAPRGADIADIHTLPGPDLRFMGIDAGVSGGCLQGVD